MACRPAWSTNWPTSWPTLICQQTGAERVRFTTSGSLATMYAIMLSRSYTGRQLVLKMGGGWHGAQPWGLIGVSYGARGFRAPDSEGLPSATRNEVMVTRFNDSQALQEVFESHGDKIACLIVEPVIGAGGFIPATPEYMDLARELTQKHGALLISDEVIAGFRFRAGNAGAAVRHPARSDHHGQDHGRGHARGPGSRQGRGDDPRRARGRAPRAL